MIRRVLYIGRWRVHFFFLTTKGDVFQHEEEISNALDVAGASPKVIGLALSKFASGRANEGLTYANGRRHRAVIIIGQTTGGEEFQNTFIHEIYHLATAVAEGVGLNLASEAPAYIAGDSAMALSEVVCELGCKKCRHHN